MNKFTSKVSACIEKLLPVFGTDEYEDVFALVAGELTVGEQHLVHHEVQRLKEPCQRIIDLREEVKGECRKFVYEGRVHYMDPIAIEVFKKGLEKYGDYCLGVWDEVHNTENNYRVIERKRKEALAQALAFENLRKAQKLQDLLLQQQDFNEDHYPSFLLEFGAYLSRHEERMNFAVEAKVKLSKKVTIDATTRDISVNGLKLRITAAHEINKGDKVTVTLLGLNKEYNLACPEGIEYEVKQVLFVDGAIWLGLERTFSETDDLFTDYIKGFIKGNKKVYKVDLENVIDAVLKKGYEQAFFARTHSLPIFITTHPDNEFQASFALTSGYAENTLRYWKDKNSRILLEDLLTPSWLKTFIKTNKTECTLFSFSVQGKLGVRRYAAFSTQLESNTALKNVFCSVGAKKESWKTFKIQLISLSPEDLKTRFKLPQVDGDKKDKASLADSMMGFVENISHCVLISDVTDKAAAKIYASKPYDKTKVKLLAEHEVAAKQVEYKLKNIPIGLEELRKEPRYVYKTKAIIQAGNNKLVATTLDFSTQGVKLEAGSTIPLNKGDTLHLSFPLLQKITKKHQLANLPYEIVGFDKNKRIVFTKSIDTENHQGSSFFHDLIVKNQNKLNIAQESDKIRALSVLLKSIYQKALVTVPFFIHNINKQCRLNKMIVAKNTPQLLHQFDSDKMLGQLNLKPLIDNESFSQFINQFNKIVSFEQNYTFIDMYFSLADDGNNLQISSQRDLSTLSARKMFVDSALRKGQFHCWRFFTSPVSKVELNNITNELHYISQYAHYKSAELNDILSHIAAVGEVVDISQQVIDYLGINTAEIMKVDSHSSTDKAAPVEDDEFGGIPG
ncbi:PilZ domain-containing protein [Flocculibacter collagenilyticus]|uniref:PilZ domain-containing protein n=1 Tax=Flocculibacter collagenilyticus TaxID=2744479 RepID=UPI0018F5D4A2|nr:PilZ domain-containing protein [Flocculibacter collagenilyticus]